MSDFELDLLDAALVLRAHFGPLKPIARIYEWRWRAVAYGRCVRCHWPAHTLGPDERPWHAFCWWNVDVSTSWWDQWVRRKVAAGEWGS